jgi:hypothetical protein
MTPFIDPAREAEVLLNGDPSGERSRDRVCPIS